MEQASRKKLRLQEYSYDTPGAYFITVCTKNREHILGTVGADDHIGPYPEPSVGGDAHIAPYVKLTPMGIVAEKYLRTIPGIDHYVVMPNHVHMILRISAENVLSGPMWASAPTNTSVSSSVRSWKTLVTKELGQSIWQRSYYDHVIRNEQDYWETVRYIEQNPAKWYYHRGG